MMNQKSQTKDITLQNTKVNNNLENRAIIYKYRLKYRPCGIGCQPNDFILHENMDKKTTGFWGELTYNRKLSDEEVYKFELTAVEQ